MATSPHIQVTPSGASKMYFDLAGNEAHKVTDEYLGPSGPIVFTMDDWSDGHLTVEEGLMYRQGMRKYVSSTGADASFPGQVIVQSVATSITIGSGPGFFPPIKQTDFVPSGGTINTYLIGEGRYVHKLVNPGTTNNWTQARDLGSGVTAKDVIAHGNKIIVAYDTGFDWSPDGSVWTTNTSDADAFGTLNQNVLRADENIVYSASDVTGSWDSGTTVGDNNSDINSLVPLEQILMVGKSDGVYTIDQDGTSVQMTPELRTQRNANIASVRASGTFNGDYFFRTLNGLIEISGADGQKRRVGFDQLASPDLSVPNIKALAWDDRFLYAMTDNTSGSLSILRRSARGAWHVAHYNSGSNPGQQMYVSGVFGFPALMFVDSPGGTHTSRYIRLSAFPNPLQDTNYRFTTTAVRIRLPRIGSSAAQMLIDRLDIQSRNLAAGITITPYYSADGGAVTQFGAAAVSTSPSATVTPTTAITCNFFDLYFELVTNSAATTPVLTGFTLHGVWRPGMRRTHKFIVLADTYHADGRGGQVKQAPNTTITNLQTLRTQATYSTFIDENNQSFSGVVTDVRRTMVRLSPPATEPSHAVEVTVMEKAS